MVKSRVRVEYEQGAEGEIARGRENNDVHHGGLPTAQGIVNTPVNVITFVCTNQVRLRISENCWDGIV